MTIKQFFLRFFLLVLTVLVLVTVVSSLTASLSKPQVQFRLQLYQTDLVLQASELKTDTLDLTEENADSGLTAITSALLGDDIYLNSQQQYQQAYQVTQKSITQLQKQLQQLNQTEGNESGLLPIPQTEDDSVAQQLQKQIAELNQFINKLNLKFGIILAQRGQTQAALQTWENLAAQTEVKPEVSQTAIALDGLWNRPPVEQPNSEALIKENLNGWFRYRTLEQLYQVQERSQDLANLQSQAQDKALSSFLKLALISGISILGGFLGIGLLIFLLIQRLVKKDQSLLATNSNKSWKTPWNAEIIWQVLVVGFFFIGQILLPYALLPYAFYVIGVNPLQIANLSVRLQAVYVLVSYLLMAGGGLFVLYWSIKPFFPLPKDWFRFQWSSNWINWGLGGYLVAIPLVVIVSLINQELWQGQGGSNPLLFLALEAQDKVALVIFFVTASVAAPVFEETMFRGFLLPSLTRYLPVGSAILVSSLIFSVAHLSLSEVLPLTMLGIILGFVYTRSRNLLSSILLHSLWNSGTLLSLFVLGSNGS